MAIKRLFCCVVRRARFAPPSRGRQRQNAARPQHISSVPYQYVLGQGGICVENDTAIIKALKILLSYLPEDVERSTSELSAALGYNQSTTSRILRVLTEYGFLRQNPDTRRYSLGPSITELSMSLTKRLRSSIASIAQPHLSALQSRTGYTVTMEVLAGNHTVMASVLEGNRPVHIASAVGNSVPWNAAAGLKAILAYSPMETVTPILEQEMPPYTSRTITTREAYLSVLEQVRSRGFAWDDGEISPGFTTLSAPVFNHERRPVAAICLIGTNTEVSLDNLALVTLIQETARSISRDLMCPGI